MRSPYPAKPVGEPLTAAGIGCEYGDVRKHEQDRSVILADDQDDKRVGKNIRVF